MGSLGVAICAAYLIFSRILRKIAGLRVGCHITEELFNVQYLQIQVLHAGIQVN